MRASSQTARSPSAIPSRSDQLSGGTRQSRRRPQSRSVSSPPAAPFTSPGAPLPSRRGRRTGRRRNSGCSCCCWGKRSRRRNWSPPDCAGHALQGRILRTADAEADHRSGVAAPVMPLVAVAATIVAIVVVVIVVAIDGPAMAVLILRAAIAVKALIVHARLMILRRICGWCIGCISPSSPSSSP